MTVIGIDPGEKYTGYAMVRAREGLPPVLEDYETFVLGEDFREYRELAKTVWSRIKQSDGTMVNLAKVKRIVIEVPVAYAPAAKRMSMLPIIMTGMNGGFFMGFLMERFSPVALSDRNLIQKVEVCGCRAGNSGWMRAFKGSTKRTRAKLFKDTFGGNAKIHSPLTPHVKDAALMAYATIKDRSVITFT
jgi:hypothetical protein